MVETKEDVRGGSEPPSSLSPLMSPSPPSSPEFVAIDLPGFNFSVTIHLGMDLDRLHLPEKFVSIFDSQDPHEIILWLAGGATVMWFVEVLFDRVA
jgi:hypothetical protein